MRSSQPSITLRKSSKTFKVISKISWIAPPRRAMAKILFKNCCIRIATQNRHQNLSHPSKTLVKICRQLSGLSWSADRQAKTSSAVVIIWSCWKLVYAADHHHIYFTVTRKVQPHPTGYHKTVKQQKEKCKSLKYKKVRKYEKKHIKTHLIQLGLNQTITAT